jgi:quercetin dioxygenase-like cupin family protein
VQKTSLIALARVELREALAASSGRSARTVFGGHEHLLRQTVIAMRADETLAEHVNPGEATVQVLHGRVLLTAGEDSWSGMTGDLIIVPDLPHSLLAVEDSTVLLTVVKHR